MENKDLTSFSIVLVGNLHLTGAKSSQMEKSNKFRSVRQDPQEMVWLQRRNCKQMQKSEGHDIEETRSKNSETFAAETVAQTKGVRFHTEKYTRSKIPFWGFPADSIPEFTGRNKNEKESYGRLKNLTELKPITGLSTLRKHLSYQVRSEPAHSGTIYTVRESRTRSFSSQVDNNEPANNKPNLSRRNSTLSLFSDRPSNIPVLIRNNNVRLRKYSCPEFYSRKIIDSMEHEGFRELNTKRFAGGTATNVSSNTSQQLTRKLNNQTTREKIFSEQSNAKDKMICAPSKHASEEPEPHYGITDINANEIHSSSSSDDHHKGLGLDSYEDESWQSYSLDAQPPKQNLPSSMYSSRSNMLEWLGEVNRSNPQLWD